MRKTLTFIAWAFVAAAIIYCAVGTDRGVMLQSPGAAIGLGLIGLGLCVSARQRRRPQTSSVRST